MKLSRRLSGYRFVAGNVALDFVNTVGNRLTPSKRIDHFGTNEDLLVEWVRRAGLYHDGYDGTQLRDAVKLREALYRIFAARLSGLAPRRRDTELLNAFVRSARASWRLQPEGPDWRWRWARGGTVSYSLARVAESAAELLTSKDLRLLRQCGDAECGWLFLDRSQGHRRKWCSMQDCGNRAKARRFFAKRVSRLRRTNKKSMV